MVGGGPIGDGSVGFDPASSSSLAGRTPFEKPEILLGSYGTQSGIAGAALVSVPPAIRAWAADVNARGGLNGHPVRVIIRDDKGDPGVALSVARQLNEQNRILAFFGVFGAATQHAVTPYIEKERIPVIGGVPHIDTDRSPMFFVPQAGATYGTYRAYLAAVVSQSSARKIGMMYARECSVSCQVGAEIIKEYAPKIGVEIVYESLVSAAQPDYTAEMLGAKNAGAEAMMLMMGPSHSRRAIRSALRQGYRPVFSGGPAWYTSSFAEAGSLEEVEGVFAYASLAPYDISSRMRAYLNAIRRFVPGGSVGDFGAQIWAGGKLFEAISPALGDRATRGEIFRGLYSLKGETLGDIVPPLTFPRGAHAKVNLCSVSLKFLGGRWTAPRGDTFVCTPDDGRIYRRS